MRAAPFCNVSQMSPARDRSGGKTLCAPMIELLTNAEMAEADRFAVAAGVPSLTLMENAGRAVADVVARRHPLGTRVVVIGGPGNNGGDGFVAARLLAQRGYPVRVLLAGDPERLTGDAGHMARLVSGPIEPATPRSLEAAGVIIDALFGAGLDRPVEGRAREMIEAMNGCGAPIVAIDLPSGINGTTGAIMGVAINAVETVTFFRRKPGHVLLPGRLHCGRLRVVDIGIPDASLERIRPRIALNVLALWAKAFPIPRIDGHKYTRGHAIVVSGGRSRTGAARLAARAALRAGAGLVTIASPREALDINAAANLTVMVRPVDGAADLAILLADRRLNAVVLGPGGGVGSPMRKLIGAALASQAGVVLDADGLTSFAGELAMLAAAVAARTERATVLTPHQGEFDRLFGDVAPIAKARSKCEAASAAAAHVGSVVVLKGPDTVVASPDGRASIAENAPPWLATAGTGDVLSGLVGGLIAQGMQAYQAACAAVWLHGQCGQEAGPGMIAEDLPEVLPRVYRTLFAEIAEHPTE